MMEVELSSSLAIPSEQAFPRSSAAPMLIFFRSHSMGSTRSAFPMSLRDVAEAACSGVLLVRFSFLPPSVSCSFFFLLLNI